MIHRFARERSPERFDPCFDRGALGLLDGARREVGLEGFEGALIVAKAVRSGRWLSS